MLTATFFIYPPSHTDASATMPSSGLMVDLRANKSASYPGSGTTWFDLSGNGRNASFNGSTPTWSSDRGGSFILDGGFHTSPAVGDHFKLPTNDFANFTGGFSISVVANFGSQPSGHHWERLIDFGNGQASDNLIFGRYGSSNDLIFDVLHGATSQGSCVATNGILVDTWATYAVTIDGTRCVLYRDGVEIRNISYTPKPLNLNRNLNYIGRSNWSADAYLDPGISAVAVWNRGLTASEALTVHQMQNDVTAPSTSVGISSTYLTSGTSVSTILSTNETLSSVTLYYSTSSSLTSAQSCGTTSNPTNGQTLTCTIPATDATYYIYSVGTDSAGNVESAPISADDSIIRDTVAPVVNRSYATATSGSYSVGSTPPVYVEFSETVTVTGSPRITMETGDNDRDAVYAAGSGTRILNFTYTIQSGDTSPDLDYVSTTALFLNGGTITDLAGNAATLTLPAPGSPNSYGASRNIVIDTTPPQVSSATLGVSGLTITIVMNETMIADTGKASTSRFSVTINGGDTTSVTAVSHSGFNVSLTLSSAVRAGRTVTINYQDPTAGNDANAIQDLAGNDATSFSNQPVTNNSTVLNLLSTPTTLAVTTAETSSATFSFTATTNASSHTLRLYESSTATLLSTTTSFASGSSRTGLTPATQYYATLQAVGDGITYESSSASSPVYFTTAIRKPVITSQPIDTSTTTSRNAGFAVTATSADSGSLSYQWQQSTDSGVSFADIPSANAATLSISSVTSASNGYRYRVVITNSKSGVSASETSTSATLTVNGAITLSGGSNISKAWDLEATSLPITASGGTGGIIFTISRSAPEVLINSSSGEVTSPAEVMARGTYNETITATDERGATATKSITITVGVGTPTITLRFSAAPMKGFNLTITATTSTAGTVRFFEKGRVIAGCKARATTGGVIVSASLGSRTATCLWKPRIHGPLAVKAVLTPTSGDFASASTSQNVVVVRRSSR